MNLEEVKNYIKENDLDIISKRRDIVYRRSYLFKYIRKEFGFSYETIGKIFNKDHSTVMHGINKIYNQFKEDKEFIGHVYNEISNFPITGEKPNLPNKNTVLINFNREMYLKVQLYRINNGIPTNEEAIKRIIETI